MILFAVDPGTLQSALVVVEPTARGVIVREHYTALNAVILAKPHCAPLGATLVIESVAPMGMPIGYEVMRTIFWSGRFYETWPNEERYELTRGQIKHHLCNSARANDANIRQVLIDRFGPGKDAAIGTIKKQGPLYGLRQHDFAALAVAVTWLEQRPITSGQQTSRIQPVAIESFALKA